jgi:hypothetical protein
MEVRQARVMDTFFRLMGDEPSGLPAAVTEFLSRAAVAGPDYMALLVLDARRQRDEEKETDQ